MRTAQAASVAAKRQTPLRPCLFFFGLLLAAPAVAATEQAYIIVATPVSGTIVTSDTSKGCDGYTPGTIRMNANGAAQLCRP